MLFKNWAWNLAVTAAIMAWTALCVWSNVLIEVLENQQRRGSDGSDLILHSELAYSLERSDHFNDPTMQLQSTKTDED